MNRLISLLIAVTLALTGTALSQKPLKVVTTLSYLKYVTEQVGGNHVSVVALANPKQDPHYVTPTPRMNEITNSADMFIENGLSLELWAKNVLDASGNPKIQSGNPGHLIATLNVPIRELPTEISRSWGDIHPQGNPHVWLDPFNVKIIADNIADRLSQIDPANEEDYRKNVEAFKNRLDIAMFGEPLLTAIGKRAGEILTRKANNDELTEWLKAKHLLPKLGGWMAEVLPYKGSKIVSYHKTYIYFAERFGFNIVSELEEKPGIPPPPQRRDAIVEQIKRDHVKVILNDNFYSREAADYVASKTDAKVIVTYIDVGASEEANTYENLISYLIGNVTRALH
jgi:zinc/manganese transport system substrate-binding protein